MSFFPQTSWTVIANAARASTLDLEKFCRDYRQPIYSFARGKGLSHEDAEDLTQTFFVSVLRRSLLEKADPAIGRLRNYLLKHLSFVLRDYFKFRNAVSRGGQAEFVPISTTFCGVPGSAEGDPPLVSEEIVHEVTEEFQRAYEQGQPDIPFEKIRPFLIFDEETERPSYDDIVRDHPQISAAALRKRVSRLREDFKKLLIVRVPELKHYSIKPRRDARSRFDRIAGQGDISPETAFNREWATCVLESARRQLRREYNEKFGEPPFKILESIFRGEEPDFAAIHSKFPNVTKTEIEERSTFLRQRFVEIRNAVVASTVADEGEVYDEIRELDECWLMELANLDHER